MLKEMMKKLKRKNARGIEERDINLNQLKELEKQGAIIVDVRSPQEYEEGHLDGAILLPEYEIKTKARQTLKEKEKVIIVYCSCGIRSKKAAKELTQMGYINIYNLSNGLEYY